MEKIALQHRGTWRYDLQTVHKSDGAHCDDLMLNGAINGPLHKLIVIKCLVSINERLS